MPLRRSGNEHDRQSCNKDKDPLAEIVWMFLKDKLEVSIVCVMQGFSKGGASKSR